jgi:hypothetical protein
MNSHKNAHLTPKDRDAMVRAFVTGGLTKAVAPRQCHTMPKTIGKWVDRFLTQWLPRKRRFVAITRNSAGSGWRDGPSVTAACACSNAARCRRSDISR